MQEVRLGVIGCGNMGLAHMASFAEVPRLKFTAVSDSRPELLKQVTEKYQVAGFDDGEKLIASGTCDAVLVATPHYLHPPLTIAAFKAGLHVMCEKPLAVTALAAQEMIAEADKHPKLVFGLMLQQRTNPKFRKAKELLKAGELGAIQRVNWIITNWFRSQTYYNSGGWRATWAGEGGGVLINQCPHNLDMLCWLAGTPQRVHAHVALGKYHHIEVEDEVTAYLEWDSGATGVFIATTGEAPGTDRLEIVGDRGRMVLEGERVTFDRTQMSVREFCQTAPDAFASITTDTITIQPGGKPPHHTTIMRAFIDAILDGTAPIADGREGLAGLELGNAMLMSGLTKQTVSIPTDRAAFDKLMRDLAAKSTFKKGPVRNARVDMTASFH